MATCSSLTHCPAQGTFIAPKPITGSRRKGVCVERREKRIMQSATARALPGQGRATQLATLPTSNSSFAHPHSFSKSPELKWPIVEPWQRGEERSSSKDAPELCAVEHSPCNVHCPHPSDQSRSNWNTCTAASLRSQESLGIVKVSVYVKSHCILPV